MKLKKKYQFFNKLNIIFSVFLLGSLFVSAQNNALMQEVYLLDDNDLNPYVEFYSTDIKDFFEPENSSNYPSTNLFDGKLETCWVTNSNSSDSNNNIFIKIPAEIPLAKLILNIFSGYGKNENLFYSNARPKSLSISIFSAYSFDVDATEVANKYYLYKELRREQILLIDTFGVQSFALNLNGIDKIELLNITNAVNTYVLKIEIIDTYKGSEYNDVCISEIFFNNRFVSRKPKVNQRVEKVYIANSNTVLLDTENGKTVIVYQDSSLTFTNIEWNINWAIVQYVKNEELGQNKRHEELSLLLDLRNKKNMNKELEYSMGANSDFIIMEYFDKSVYLIDYNLEYKIELK